MKKYIWLTFSVIFLLLSAYSMTVLLVFCIGHALGGIGGYAVLSAELLFTIIGVVIVSLGYVRHRFGRFNQDIFATILLFVLFMLSFLIPGDMPAQYVGLAHWFPAIGKLVSTLGNSSIGIYEVFLFIAMLCCGMTIGEDKNRKYYE